MCTHFAYTKKSIRECSPQWMKSTHFCFFFEEIRKFWLDFTMVTYEKIYFEVYISNTIDSKIILHNFTTCNAMDWLSGLSGATISFYMLTSPLISLHIRSMWETICDAWACWSGWNFGPNSTEDPYSELGTEYPPPPRKLSESPNLRVSEYPPNENCQRVQIREFQNTPSQMKIVRESMSESFRIPCPNENCQRVQIREFQNTPPNENCQRVQIREFQNIPPNENCQRVQIREFQNIPPKWKLSESANPRVSEYPPKMKIVREFKSESFRISPNARVSEYPPPKMKIVRESKSEIFRIPPQMKIVRESKSKSFRIPPQNRKNFRFQTSE